MIERLSTVLPEPDSPTTPSDSPRRIDSDTPSTARTRPTIGLEVRLQIVEDQQRLVGMRSGDTEVLADAIALRSNLEEGSQCRFLDVEVAAQPVAGEVE